MKKQLKVGLLSALAVLGVASAASCGGNQESSSSSSNTGSTYDGNGRTINIAINYSQKNGVSYQGKDATTLPYGENITLASGQVLPTWQCIGQKLNLNVTDGADYSKAQKDNWTSYVSEGFKDANGNNISLVMGTQTLYETAISNNKLVAISDHLDEMPNFKAWTQKNASTYKSMKSNDGNVYYTPYFDGQDDIEKMNLMNVEWIEKLLDTTFTADTSKTITKTYEPTVTSEAEAKVIVWDGSARKTIKVNYSAENNAIKKQNDLTTLNGQTLLKALKEALIAEYGNYISTEVGGSATGSNVIYTKLSEIFTGEKACYNVDDLVALIRCVKTNPTALTGDASTTIWPIVPRGSKTSRQYQMGELASWWGVRGMSGENGNLYFDLEGNIKDARTQDSTYTALNNIHKIYEEGLIYEGFASKDNNNTDDMFRKSGMTAGTVFMVYDYNSSTCQYNKDCFETSKTNLQAVLPPVAKWAGNKTVKLSGTSYSGYFHFSEDNRALKTGGWAIPSSVTGENLSDALAVMDYMFSTEGSLIQDFGPDTKYTTTTNDHKAGEYVFWTPYAESTEKLKLAGVEQPEITQGVKAAIKTSGQGWNDYYRTYIGSTQGIGHVRHGGLDYECLWSEKGKAGLNMLEQAMEDNVFALVKTSFDDETSLFCNSMVTGIPVNANIVQVYESDAAYKTMTDFWNNSKSKVVWTGAYVIMKGWQAPEVTAVVSSEAALKGLFTQYDTVYTSKVQAAFNNMGIIEK